MRQRVLLPPLWVVAQHERWGREYLQGGGVTASGWSGLQPGGEKPGKVVALLSPINQKDPPGSWQLFAWHGGMALVSLRLRALRYRGLGGGDP